MEIPPTDLAYAAGVIDSDGCVTVSRSKALKGHSFRIAVNMTNIEDMVPLWFKAKFGGYVGHRRASKIRFGQVWKWGLSCNKAADFLELILPYLKLKQYRAKLAIELARKHRRRAAPVFTPHEKRKGGLTFAPLSEQELEERERLASGIRAENVRSNTRVPLTSKSLIRTA